MDIVKEAFRKAEQAKNNAWARYKNKTGLRQGEAIKMRPEEHLSRFQDEWFIYLGTCELADDEAKRTIISHYKRLNQAEAAQPPSEPGKTL